LDRHARRLNYPEMLARGLPVDSGGIESLCKQLGTRLKSGGKRWNSGNVTPMALLTCRWVTGQLSSPPQVRTSPQLL
jgi:hypothetical protein